MSRAVILLAFCSYIKKQTNKNFRSGLKDVSADLGNSNSAFQGVVFQ